MGAMLFDIRRRHQPGAIAMSNDIRTANVVSWSQGRQRRQYKRKPREREHVGDHQDAEKPIRKRSTTGPTRTLIDEYV